MGFNPVNGLKNNNKKEITYYFVFKFYRVRFPIKKWSRLNFGVLGPKKSDSSSKTTYIVLFPGLNSPITPKILNKKIY